MTLDAYKDGTARVLPTIVINRMDGFYVVCLQDHASHQQVSVVVSTLEGVAAALEAAMANDVDAFRPYASKKVKDPAKRAPREKA